MLPAGQYYVVCGEKWHEKISGKAEKERWAVFKTHKLFIYGDIILLIFYCTGCIEKYKVKIIPIIIRTLIHTPFCILNSILLACRAYFAEVSDAAEKVEQVCIRLFTADSRTARHDEVNSRLSQIFRERIKWLFCINIVMRTEFSYCLCLTWTSVINPPFFTDEVRQIKVRNAPLPLTSSGCTTHRIVIDSKLPIT